MSANETKNKIWWLPDATMEDVKKQMMADIAFHKSNLRRFEVSREIWSYLKSGEIKHSASNNCFRGLDDAPIFGIAVEIAHDLEGLAYRRVTGVPTDE